MNISEETLKQLWIKRYGNNAWVKDCYGCWIYYFDHGRDCKARKNPDGVVEPCGWEIDHILPEARGGTDSEFNLEFVYGPFNAMKGDQTQYKLTGPSLFKIVKRPCKQGYGIYNATTGTFIDWISKH